MWMYVLYLISAYGFSVVFGAVLGVMFVLALIFSSDKDFEDTLFRAPVSFMLLVLVCVMYSVLTVGIIQPPLTLSMVGDIVMYSTLLFVASLVAALMLGIAMYRLHATVTGLKVAAAFFGSMSVVFAAIGFTEAEPLGWFIASGIAFAIFGAMFVVGPPKASEKKV